MFAGIAGQFHPAVHSKLFGQVAAMSFNRADTQCQFFRDLAVGIPLNNQPQNINFTRGEHLPWARHSLWKVLWVVQAL